MLQKCYGADEVLQQARYPGIRGTSAGTHFARCGIVTRVYAPMRVGELEAASCYTRVGELEAASCYTRVCELGRAGKEKKYVDYWWWNHVCRTDNGRSFG